MNYPSIQILLSVLLEMFRNLPIRIAYVELYCFKVIFTEEALIIYPLTSASICGQRILAKFFSLSIISTSFKFEIT